VQNLWTSVDDYITSSIAPSDPVLDAALKASAAAGLPSIQVSAPQGKFLMLLAQMCGARAILEIGTLGGYSAIWLARALPPGGRLVTLEYDPTHAAVARTNLDRAGFASVARVIEGRAIDTLADVAREGLGPFDFIFIDADKVGYPDYLAWALRLSRRGTVIVADNIVRKGAIADAASTDASVLGVRRFNELIAADPRLSATTIQTVGAKGYDGFTIAIVTRDA
jgi:predicted O-methyltransferase YrrM